MSTMILRLASLSPVIVVAACSPHVQEAPGTGRTVVTQDLQIAQAVTTISSTQSVIAPSSTNTWDRDSLTLREKKVSRIDELIVAELLAEHPDVRAAIATTKGTKHADPIVEKDLIAIAGVLTNHPNFVPSPYGGSIIRHERFTEAVIPGKMISGGIGDDEAFVNLLKLPDGRWILLEVSMGPR